MPETAKSFPAAHVLAVHLRCSFSVWMERRPAEPASGAVGRPESGNLQRVANLLADVYSNPAQRGWLVLFIWEGPRLI
ncbi:MAG: hypothetical protein JO307_11080 [Bryobacterales bacterium]|nr:hypothetical protein [Bryobacterales bacterium]